MHELIFRNKWIALIWALSMLGSAALFAGQDGAQDKLANVTQNAAPPAPNEAELAAEPTVEDNLVDDPEEVSEDQADGVDPDKPRLVKPAASSEQPAATE